MQQFLYPNKEDLVAFIGLISVEKYKISRYLPPIGQEWYEIVADCIGYVKSTSQYQTQQDFYSCCAQLLYKIAKRHELGDGNKRSAVIAVYMFCLLNDYMIVNPQLLKGQAKRAARTKGRIHEDLMKDRIAKVLSQQIKKDF